MVIKTGLDFTFKTAEKWFHRVLRNLYLCTDADCEMTIQYNTIQKNWPHSRVTTTQLPRTVRHHVDVRGHSEPVITLANILLHLFTLNVHEETSVDGVLLASTQTFFFWLDTWSNDRHRRSSLHRCATQHLHCSQHKPPQQWTEQS